MQVTYRFRFDSAYAKNAIARRYQQAPIFVRFHIVFYIAGFVAFAIVVGVFGRSQDSVAFGLATFLIVTFSSVSGVKGVLLGRHRRLASFGSELTVVLLDTGLIMTGRHVESKVEWSYYPSSVRFRDGILLKSADGKLSWLPDSGIEVGTSTEATDLVAFKTKLRRVA